MTKLIVVRHGETKWNNSRVFQGHQDTELSELGLRQAEYLAKRLAGEKIDYAYASDLKRAYRTATVALTHHQLAVRPDRRLREMAFGWFEGLNYDQIVQRYPEDWASWRNDLTHVAPPGGGETLQEVMARVAEFFEEVKREHPEETVLVVTHAGPIRALLCLILHMDWEYFLHNRVDNTSVSIVDTYGDKAYLSLLNDTCHLRDLC